MGRQALPPVNFASLFCLPGLGGTGNSGILPRAFPAFSLALPWFRSSSLLFKTKIQNSIFNN